jgi:hypothetical protein
MAIDRDLERRSRALSNKLSTWHVEKQRTVGGASDRADLEFSARRNSLCQ